MQRFTQSVILGCLLASTGWAGQFYSDRPPIANIKAAEGNAPEIAPAALVQSAIDYVIEMRIFYGKRKRAHLGRDGELAYDIDWLLWSMDDKQTRGPEPILINVSTKSIGSPDVLAYLDGKKLADAKPGEVVGLDTGYDATIVDGINRILRKKNLSPIFAHLISSTHASFPSSRVATWSLLPPELQSRRLNTADKEAFLDVVDAQVEALEGLPHFTESASEFRTHPKSGELDAYAVKDALPEIQKRSKSLREQVVRQVRDGAQRAFLLERTLRAVLESLDARRQELPRDALKAAVAVPKKLGFTLFWHDLREAYSLGGVDADYERLRTLWENLPGGRPEFFDLEPDQIANLRAKEKARKHGKPVLIELSAEIALPRTIEEILALHDQEKQAPAIARSEALLGAAKSRFKRGIVVDGRALAVGASIGEGCRGDVFELGTEHALKVAADGDDVRYFMVERAVETLLIEEYSTYGIRVWPILERGEGDTYFVRRKIPKENLGETIARGRIEGAQLERLELLFQRAKLFAARTGIGLDIKFDNLAWIDGDWVVFDAGPRTSYGPYAMTLDIESFEDFLKKWQIDEPRKNGLSIEKYLAERSHWTCIADLFARELAPE